MMEHDRLIQLAIGCSQLHGQQSSLGNPEGAAVHPHIGHLHPLGDLLSHDVDQRGGPSADRHLHKVHAAISALGWRLMHRHHLGAPQPAAEHPAVGTTRLQTPSWRAQTGPT